MNLYFKHRLDYSFDFNVSLYRVEEPLDKYRVFPVYKASEGRICLNLHKEWY